MKVYQRYGQRFIQNNVLSGRGPKIKSSSDIPECTEDAIGIFFGFPQLNPLVTLYFLLQD